MLQCLSLNSSDNAIALVGEREENLKTLQQQTGASFVLRGQELHIEGTEKQVQLAKTLVRELESFWGQGEGISAVDILAARHALNTQQATEWQALKEDQIAKTRKGTIIRAKTFRQRRYVQSIRRNALTFGIGPAGTGKTYLAAIMGIQALLDSQYERLVLTRPAVEAGEKLGFLPGDLQQKVNPYLRPLYDALYDIADPERIATLMEKGVVEIAPLAYMRGRTLNNSFVILDEAQNTTPPQMKMMLTRLGQRSRLVVTGDVTQTDLPSHQSSGLAIAEKILTAVDDVEFCYLSKGDVVRHPLVEKILAAYEVYETRSAPRPRKKTPDESLTKQKQK
ncbi:MAG: PhoH family protein [Cyanobacteria bacterium P01_F01_bin.42]